MAIRPIEIFLIQFILYIGLWLWDEYLATLLSATFICIFSAILIISIIAELIERSKVPRSYFYFMILSIITPILAAIIFITIMGGEISWITEG